MSEYDLFTQIKPYNYSVSLFGDAATQGIAAGNALPTNTTAAIRGAMEGFETGQRMQSNQATIEGQQQQNQIRQNQIEQLPVQNEMDRVQLENAKRVESINQMRLELDQQTQSLKLQTEEARTKAELAKFKEETHTLDVKKAIAEDLSSPDSAVRKKVLQDPEKNAVMFSDHNYAESIAGALSQGGGLTKEESDGLWGRIDFSRKKEMEMQLEAQKEKNRASQFKDLDNIRAKLNDSPEITNSLAAMGYGPDNYEDLLHKNVEVVRADQKTYKKNKDGTYSNDVDTSVPDKYTGSVGDKAISYEIIVDGKRSPQSLARAEDAATFNKWLRVNRDHYGIAPMVKAATAPPPAQGEAPAKQEGNWFTRLFSSSAPETPRTEPEINKSISDVDVSPAEAMPVIEKAVEETPQKNFIERLVDKAIPPALQDKLGGYDAITRELSNTAANEDIKTFVSNKAAQLTEKTLDVFVNGDPEEKQSIRQMLGTNNVKMDKGALTAFFAKRIRGALAGAYQDTLTATNLKKAKEANAVQATQNLIKDKGLNQARGATRTIESLADEPLKATGGGGAAVSFSPASMTMPSVIETLDNKVSELSTRYSLPDNEASRIKKTITRIEQNDYLKDQAPYVKAIAAVESAGKEGAVSPTGVKGYMQVTKKVAASYGLDRNDPEQNIEAGSRYLDDLIAQFRGNKALAYAAYNAGPAVIRYAQKLAGGSNIWSDLKPHLLAALTRYQGAGNWKPASKLKELYNYPDKVMMHEEIFAGAAPTNEEVI